MEGRPKFQRLGGRFDIVLQLTKAVPWALLYVVALLMALSLKLQAPILRSVSGLFGDFIFPSFPDYPSDLVFPCRQCAEDSL